VYTRDGALLDASGNDVTATTAQTDGGSTTTEASKALNTGASSVPDAAKAAETTKGSSSSKQEATSQAPVPDAGKTMKKGTEGSAVSPVSATTAISSTEKPEPAVLELASTASKTAAINEGVVFVPSTTAGLNEHFLAGKKDQVEPDVVPCFGKGGVDSAAQAINRQSGLSPSEGFDLDPNVQATAVAEEANAIREAEEAAVDAKAAEPEAPLEQPAEKPASEPAATVADAIMEEVEHLPGQWARGDRDGLGEGPPVSMLKDDEGLGCVSKLSYSACGERGCKWSKMSGMCSMPQGKVYSIIMNGQKTDGCGCSDPKDLVQSSKITGSVAKTGLVATSADSPGADQQHSADGQAQRVAILLRGAPYRDFNPKTESDELGWHACPIESCQQSAKEQQRRSTESVMDSFITPMEKAGLKVDVFIQAETCGTEMDKALSLVYGDRVQEVSLTAPNQGQAKTKRSLLDQYNRHVKVTNKAYSQVYVLRIDLELVKPYTSWKLNNDTVNVASMAPNTIWGTDEKEIYNDIFFMVPAKHWDDFDATIGKPGCFEMGGDAVHQAGHLCVRQKALDPAHVSVAWDWSPEDTPSRSVQEDSPYMTWWPPRAGSRLQQALAAKGCPATPETKRPAPAETNARVLGMLLQTGEGAQVSKVGSMMAWIGDHVSSLASTLHAGLM
jgi:hypothetical protein